MSGDSSREPTVPLDETQNSTAPRSEHSVAQHLGIAIDSYDREIRRYIRAYDQMLDQAIDCVVTLPRLDRVLDLGCGTGALSERLLERRADAVVELWDIDPAMLEQARLRLARFADRVRPCSSSFFEPLGEAAAVMASLALHHVRDLSAKGELYSRIGSALEPGGVFVNADVTVPADAALANVEYQVWAGHQVESGFTRQEALQNFEDWSQEDRYFPLGEELSLLEQAGLEPSCPWRRRPSTVVMGRRPS